LRSVEMTPKTAAEIERIRRRVAAGEVTIDNETKEVAAA
jgi:hypothetical protein